MTICKTCGAKIDFIRSPKGGKIPVAARAGYYIPDSTGPTVFVTSKGEVRKAPQVRREVESYAVIHPKNRTYAQRTPGREKRKTARTVEKLSSLLRVDDPIVILPHFCGNCKREVLL